MISTPKLSSPIWRGPLDGVRRLRAWWLWVVFATASTVAFFSIPGGYNETAHSLLHGLCAQTPSHTMMFGDAMLPFDSRMTGIYGGVLVTVATVAARGRLFWYGNPPVRVVAMLGAMVGLMAVDGFNSLLNDLGMWHAYTPHNAPRIVTGYGAGVALAVVLCWLIASSVWRIGVAGPAIAKVSELAVPAIGLGGFGLLLLVRPEWMHFPVSMLLVLSAWIAVTMLVLVIVLLAFKLDAKVSSLRQLHVPVATASVLAISVMVALAGGRYWLERTFGITNAMM